MDRQLVKSLNKVEQGNTVAGASAKVAECIFRLKPSMSSLFDIPSGQGYFIRSLLSIKSDLKVRGLDPYAQPLKEIEPFIEKTTAAEWSPPQEQYDVVTCISGVMCFDNLKELFKKSYLSLKDDGLFIVTNDNVLTLRDRLSWLFFAHPKRFRLFYSQNEGNWNLVLPQALYKLFNQNSFSVKEIHYVSFRPEDLLFIPLAIILYPLQFLYLAMYRHSSLPLNIRYSLYSFRSMFCRHYIIVGQKKSNLGLKVAATIMALEAWIAVFEESLLLLA